MQEAILVRESCNPVVVEARGWDASPFGGAVLKTRSIRVRATHAEDKTKRKYTTIV
jgi:hypothetical protein